MSTVRCSIRFIAVLWVIALLAAVISLFGTRLAGADSFDYALDAYSEGRFSEAAEIAKTLENSSGYAFAAKSMVIHARYIATDPEKKQLLEQAIELARKAIESDPENADGYLWLSRALGRHSSHISKAQATKENYAKQTRDAIESALRIDPQMSAAHVSMGRWHTGIIDRVGRLLGRTLFGARKKDALQHFDQAYELNQQSKTNNLSLAIGLIEMDHDKYSDRAHNLLKQAAELPINDAYEKFIHERIIKKLSALDTSRN